MVDKHYVEINTLITLMTFFTGRVLVKAKSIGLVSVCSLFFVLSLIRHILKVTHQWAASIIASTHIMSASARLLIHLFIKEKTIYVK